MSWKYVRDSLPWLVPSAAIAFAGYGFMVNGSSLFEPRATSDLSTPAQAPASVVPESARAFMTPDAAEALEDEIVARQANASEPLAGLGTSITGATALVEPEPLASAVPAPAPAPVQTPAERQAALTTTGPVTQIFNTGQAAAQAKQQCVDDLRNIMEEVRVYFPSGGLTADEGGIERGQLIGLVAQGCPGVRIRVEGHSDPSGDPAANLRLSERRAQHVIQRIGSGGIDTSMFVAQGFGDQRPSQVFGDRPRSYYDRRVEFSVIEQETRVALRSTASPKPWANAACVADLERAVQSTALFYGPGAVSVNAQDLETALSLANLAVACPHARLRVVGHHTNDIQARENMHTGLLRAKALMAMLVARGVAPEQIIIAAPSRALGGAGLPGSRVNFDVILEES
ncbi:OmpA family protein [uncultured Tateyamaria sp.]|uniref:OmpA family protein n=1 Tax=Tateyamaria sp. TaxID=1929288 RepID=UPI00260A017D|nr:OmpA family protein [uncultured Tateyamaria sp.]